MKDREEERKTEKKREGQRGEEKNREEERKTLKRREGEKNRNIGRKTEMRQDMCGVEDKERGGTEGER